MEVHAASSAARGIRYRVIQWSSGDPPGYDEFVEKVQLATALSCNLLGTNPKLKQTKKEDELTEFVIAHMLGLGFDARLDSMVGGHCDMVVSFNGDYKWLAEAKIYKSHSWVWQGYQQLATRYQPGDPYSSGGGMLIYCFKPDTVAQMLKWQRYMKSQDSALLFPSGQVLPIAGMFYSQHGSPRSGLAQTVAHFAVPLNWAPATKAKKTKAKKGAGKKSATKKAVAKKGATKKAVAKKGATKKAVAKKGATKKAVAKKGATKKAVVKKGAAKKAVAKKGATKKAVVKKGVAKKAVAKKGATKKAVVKKGATKKAVVKKGAAKNVTAKGTSVKPVSRQ
ncbi:histone H1-like repetitive region-containing protein [Stenotrophomonas maltophilia]|uniref:histone H1-like repetitive region-containing protein n=1 Tax=Stenotrophomonas maltophilia TaxID=40324 RepID=UPI0021CA16F7|nr:histone H1-like repetitive region-containing protein [Stenotrophomonas maltophilia]MCU1176660.1 histone H1-like repetitive region-containing protein [Stenotrophomonas maltophilia]